MGAPCVTDTCSIASSIDPVTRKMIHDVILAGTGGLKCDNGLAIEIYGDPAPAAIVDAAFQQLGITPGGEVWSIPKHASVETFESAAPVPIPHSGADSASPVTVGSIVNPYASAALAIVTGRMRVGYSIDTLVEGATLATQTFGIDWIPFAGQLSAQISVDGSSRIVSYFDPSGVHPNAASPHHKRDWKEGTWVGVIGAGATWVLTGSAQYQTGQGGQVQRFNIDTETAAAAAPAFAERGLKINGQVIILPFGGDL